MVSASSLRQHGIYRNLPPLDEAAQGLTAVITGANGISGFNTMRALLDSPKRWKTIFSLSRRPPPEDMMALLSPEERSRITVVTCDFLDDPASIAENLKAAGVQADYVFFYSYVHMPWSEAEALVQSNVTLLQNFLAALEIANVTPRRFVLQTGGKNYGLHIGRSYAPLLESDPQPRHLGPNFYYPQEDLLKSYCQKHGVSWNIIMPCGIIGTSSQAGMNFSYLWGIYAAVQAHKGEPLIFGGDWESWQFESYHSSARMTGYLSEWAAIQPECANENFNAQDGGPMTWERLYPELARWFGAKGVVPPPDDDSGIPTIITSKPGREGPLGRGPPVKVRVTFSLEDWAKEEANVAAWREIMAKSGGKVRHDPFADPDGFSMAGPFMHSRIGSPCLNKARRLGWTGFNDTMESIFESFQELAQLGMLPGMQMQSARPLC